MNKERLQIVFNNYIEKFDYINSQNDEKYKWEITFDFREEMDRVIQSPLEMMSARLKMLVEKASNLLQNQWELPGAALCEYCVYNNETKREPETVRNLLVNLLKEDSGDLVDRQKRIDDFVLGCKELKSKYFPTSFKYEIGQRAAMVLLGLYDPDHNYLFKAMQANEFADCVEFYDDWGTSTHFKLPIYYQMCDQLVGIMEENHGLLQAHLRRYADPKKPLHKDKNLHILAFDIIYCSSVYHLMDSIVYDHFSSGEKKAFREKRDAAQEISQKLESAEERMKLYYEAVDYYSAHLSEGVVLQHKIFGVGTVLSYTKVDNGDRVLVHFQSDGDKQFVAAQSVVKGFISFPDPDLADRNARYEEVIMIGEKALKEEVRKYERALEPYREFLM